MRFRHKLRTFARMSASERRMIVDAVLCLAIARFIVLVVPFRFVVASLQRSRAKGPCDSALLIAVRSAVTIAARNVPWNAVCLPQALAAKAMLARRGCCSTLRLGAAFDGNGKIVAHAWLVADGQNVVGDRVADFSPLVHFD